MNDYDKLKLYVISSQDATEPWGWAPLTEVYHPDLDEQPVQAFHWTREEAEDELERVNPDPDVTCCNYKICEYDVPKPAGYIW